jgi:hypothetical protein
MAENLLEDNKVRFYGNKEVWDELNDRHRR